MLEGFKTILEEEEHHAPNKSGHHSSPKKRSDSRKHFTGEKFTIHGAFKTKEDAKKKEAKVKGSFIEEREIKGEKRFVVLKEK